MSDAETAVEVIEPREDVVSPQDSDYEDVVLVDDIEYFDAAMSRPANTRCQ
jgi:hypothetical protein